MRPQAAGGGKEPLRLMLVGDSITHGSAGDFTWRYFLHRHLRACGEPVDLVGPRNDLFDPQTQEPGSRAYADPDFDQDHASQWGNALVWPRLPIRSVAAEHRPDVVVLALGTNDLVLLDQSPEDTWDRLRQEVGGLREVDPRMRVVLVQSVAVDHPDVVRFNALVRARSVELSTPTSPVAVARAADGFVVSSPDREGDTWDHVHPDTSGQVRIAASVADALAELGVGAAYPRPLRLPPDGLREPPVLTALPGDGSVVLTWQAPPGATGHDVWLRDVSTGSRWGSLRRDVGGSATVVDDLVPGRRYEVRVQARKGFTVATSDVASEPVPVSVPVAGRPLPGPVLRWRPEGRGGRLLVTWQALPDVASYLVWWRAHGTEDWHLQQTRGTRTVVRDLPAGARYAVRLQAGDHRGVGPLSAEREATVGGSRPARVTALQLGSAAGGEVEMTWAPVRHATAYQVQLRGCRPVGRWEDLPTSQDPDLTMLRLPWRRGPRMVRVRAWNEQLPGRWSRPRVVRSRTRPT